MNRFIRTRIHRTRHFFTKINRLFKWRKVIWESEDWDYHYLLILMDKKLQEMERLHRYEGHCVNSEEKAEEINRVRQAISMVIHLDEGDYKQKQVALKEAKKIFSEDVAEQLFGWWD